VQQVDITFTPGSAEEFGLVVRGSADGTVGTRIGIRPGSGELIVDRTRSGDTGFHEAFPSTSRAPIAAGPDGSYTLQIFVDHCSVEVFGSAGLVTMTELIFPGAAQTSLTLYSTGGTADAALQFTDFGKEIA
jgi:sucrose-6-phosphate hydrolase SacC (GH32 family)